jgi:hypothetical protein
LGLKSGGDRVADKIQAQF